ncbi:hypothetical protein [Paracoccus fistulariae]|uniref:EthD domain-containing protein n=1 Tax=Paracoccus fistulariae TaxID=658446 RepID=A0ABY7SM55_9RHOB|nr:hypothetical protein [Paracoccus fistulariae]MDB6181620.1 hypothetical protein [Paracoccus fistulariae]WCR07643.1 hypothetical protein JHX87_01995 [Paracoccus fistulariae]
MLRKNIGPVTVMGFARYSAKPDVDPADLIAATRLWQRDFLAHQPGIAMHCFLGNLKGEFADAILATDEASFIAMAQEHPNAPSTRPVMDLLDRDSIRLTKNNLLGGPVPLPVEFSCVEFGTFTPKDLKSFSEEALLDASSNVESAYLANFDEAKSHFVARVDESIYSEIAFVETSGAAREICGGYMDNKDCTPMLEMFDPKSVDLDFWHVLA